MMLEGGDIIRDRIKTYNIDCDYRQGGLFVALNKRQMAELQRQKENWERYGNTDLTLIGQSELRDYVFSDVYCGALLDNRGDIFIHSISL